MKRETEGGFIPSMNSDVSTRGKKESGWPVCLLSFGLPGFLFFTTPHQPACPPAHQHACTSEVCFSDINDLKPKIKRFLIYIANISTYQLVLHHRLGSF